MGIRLTTRDVCEVSGYTKEEFRALLSALGTAKGRARRPRNTREYSRQDLLVAATIHDLEVRYGMRRAAIAEIYELLRTALSGPRALNRKARLHVTLSPLAVVYVDQTADIWDGIVADLQPVFERVDAHFGTFGETSPAQGDLRLQPSLVRGRAKSATGK
jgi:DNA-binding transcriptional MerR regulator